jgi:hypothetical protein
MLMKAYYPKIWVALLRMVALGIALQLVQFTVRSLPDPNSYLRAGNWSIEALTYLCIRVSMLVMCLADFTILWVEVYFAQSSRSFGNACRLYLLGWSRAAVRFYSTHPRVYRDFMLAFERDNPELPRVYQETKPYLDSGNLIDAMRYCDILLWLAYGYQFDLSRYIPRSPVKRRRKKVRTEQAEGRVNTSGETERYEASNAATAVHSQHTRVIQSLKEKVEGSDLVEQPEVQSLFAELERAPYGSRVFRMAVHSLHQRLHPKDRVRKVPPSVQNVAQNNVVDDDGDVVTGDEGGRGEDKCLLPETYSWKSVSGKTAYEPVFLHQFDKATQQQQRQICSSLRLLCHRGPSYPSLQTKPWAKDFPGAPREARVSRASRGIRFAWLENEGVLTIYSLTNRGSSRLHMSHS